MIGVIVLLTCNFFGTLIFTLLTPELKLRVQTTVVVFGLAADLVLSGLKGFSTYQN